MLHTFERRVLRTIFGPTKDGQFWQIRYNKALYNLCKEPETRVTVKTTKLRWVGHVLRMEDCEMTKGVMLHKPEDKRETSRPKARWIDGVNNDLKMMGVNYWRTVAMDREGWCRITEEARTQLHGL